MRAGLRRDAKGRFATQYVGCRVPGCQRLHSSKGFCKRHAKALARGRIDASGNPVPSRCQRCGTPYLPRSSQSRFCPECRARAIRRREKAWKRDNRAVVNIRIRAWKRRNRSLVRQRERTGAALRRARLRLADRQKYNQQLDSQTRRQKFLQRLSQKTLRRRGRWSTREVELLQRMYPDAAHSHEWARLFEVLGRSYVSIRGKMRALRSKQRHRAR